MPTATRQYRSAPGESWMNSWMFPQSPQPVQQQPQPQRFNPAALQVQTVRGPGIPPGIQTGPPNPLAMVAGANPQDQARAATSPLDMVAQPSFQPLAPSPSPSDRQPQPQGNALYAGSENWDTAPGWMGRSGGTYSYGAGYPTIQADQFRSRPQATPAASSRPAGTDAMSTGTRYMMGARPDVNPSAAMLELALPGIDPAVAADKARAGQIRNQTRAMAGEHNSYEDLYPPSFGARQAEARAQYARGTFPGQQGPATPWQPLVGIDLSGNLTDAQMAAMYPQGQINNPQAHPLYASAPSLFTTDVIPSAGNTTGHTVAGSNALRSLALRNDPAWQQAVASNRGAVAGTGQPTVRINTGGMDQKYAGEPQLTEQQQANRSSRQQELDLRQQYVRARGMGMNPMTMAANDTVMQGGQLTPEQMLAMQGASPETLAAYMGQARQSEAMQQGYDASARAAAMEAAAAMEGQVPGSGRAFLDQFMQGQGGQAQAMPNAIPPAVLTAVQNAPDDETAARALRFAIESGQITTEKADALMRARTGNAASTMMNPSPTRPLLPVTSDMFSGGF